MAHDITQQAAPLPEGYYRSTHLYGGGNPNAPPFEGWVPADPSLGHGRGHDDGGEVESMEDEWDASKRTASASASHEDGEGCWGGR